MKERWTPFEGRPWPENQTWYDRKDPYPRKPGGGYTVDASGKITMSSEDYLKALTAREENSKYEEKLEAWWQRMRKRGARTGDDLNPQSSSEP